jgi:hypothetical protein
LRLRVADADDPRNPAVAVGVGRLMYSVRVAAHEQMEGCIVAIVNPDVPHDDRRK